MLLESLGLGTTWYAEQTISWIHLSIHLIAGYKWWRCELQPSAVIMLNMHYLEYQILLSSSGLFTSMAHIFVKGDFVFSSQLILKLFLIEVLNPFWISDNWVELFRASSWTCLSNFCVLSRNLHGFVFNSWIWEYCIRDLLKVPIPRELRKIKILWKLHIAVARLTLLEITSSICGLFLIIICKPCFKLAHKASTGVSITWVWGLVEQSDYR